MAKDTNRDEGLDGTAPPESLDLEKVTLVYTMFNHLGDFVVMSSLMRKFDLLGVKMTRLVAHQNSPYPALLNPDSKERFFNIASLDGLFDLISRLRAEKKAGRMIFGIPMAPGSLQAFFFFWVLQKCGALTYIVDFNLNNADIITPARARYIFDRHLAQAAELFKHPEWTTDSSMPLAISCPARASKRPLRRVGFMPWSGRRWLPEFCWPDARWLELATLILQDPHVEIALLGRDAEFGQFEQTLLSGLPKEMADRFVSFPATSVEELTASLRELDLLVTLNTSTLHLAHAMQLPVVALSGSSAEYWLPEGRHVRIVQDRQGVLPPSDKYYHDPLQPSLQRISVAAVHTAYQELTATFARPN